MLISTLAIICIVLMAVSMGLHIFGLPANWVALGFAALWFVFVPDNAFTWPVFGLLIALAVAGEVIETLMGHIWGKKYGASGKATVAGIIGAIIGAILGAPILFGIGALFGALAGAFLGALAVELFRGIPSNEAIKAAWGTMLGRAGGTVLKTAIGFAMIVIAAPRIWAG